MCICKDHFGDRADHDEAIETIKQRNEVTLQENTESARRLKNS